MKAGTK